MQQLEPQTNSQPQSAQPQKKAYQSPSLRRYGDVTELTQTSTTPKSGSTDTSAIFGQNYPS